MATIVALDCTDGVLLAGDRVIVRDGSIAGTRQHVFGFEDLPRADVGAAAVGDDPDDFRRELDAALREYAVERGDPHVDAVSRMAAEVAGDAGVEALVAARDDAGRAQVRSVRDGVLEERVAALGSAAPVVLGRLETLGAVGLADGEAEVRRAFEAAAARDPGTGEDVDVFGLRNAGNGETV